MQTKYLALIICAILYFIALLISGLMALKYQQKHRPYRKVAEEYQRYWKVQKLKWMKTELLKPISTKFELPTGEKLYFVEENQSYIFDDKNRDLKELNKYGFGKYDQMENYYDEVEFMGFKSDYQLFGFKKRNFQAESKTMYVTNKRIIFDQDGIYQQIIFKDIVKAYIAIIYDNGNYFPGYIIHTQKCLYKIISSSPEITLIINQIKKMQQGDNNVSI
ncbi:hypothetical protein CXP39_02195 [Mesoplasma syrphidae]|uniref:Uncharacterized protein n=1 Tax=Mesoplasma syrphidae TaxID=225999 RepID=A0A2K9BRH4_9MOLU|nr:hypothetical protein [Mesoplasma syrphidae]AUF83602.1 hypothetical protein CXP39_02195 [Mesoplasma syrphidae]